MPRVHNAFAVASADCRRRWIARHHDGSTVPVRRFPSAGAVPWTRAGWIATSSAFRAPSAVGQGSPEFCLRRRRVKARAKYPPFSSGDDLTRQLVGPIGCRQSLSRQPVVSMHHIYSWTMRSAKSCSATVVSALLEIPLVGTSSSCGSSLRYSTACRRAKMVRPGRISSPSGTSIEALMSCVWMDAVGSGSLK